MSGVVMALDVGTRQMGVAVSDERKQMALPVETVEARDRGEAVERILEIIDDYEVDEIVVGWPLDMQGRERRAVERVRRFVERLEHRLAEGVPIHRWDERLTTTEADRMLTEADITRDRRKKAVDQVAACQILKGFLGSRHDVGERNE